MKSLKDNPIPIKTPVTTKIINTTPDNDQEKSQQPYSPSEDYEMETEQYRESSEKLEEIDLSVIAQPSISSVKTKSKAQRMEEINEEKETTEVNVEHKTEEKLPSTTIKENKDMITKSKETSKSLNSKTNQNEVFDKKKKKNTDISKTEKDKNVSDVVKSNKNEKHIAMMEGNSPYDITKDLSQNYARITFLQLLDICPKLRSQLNKAIKLKNLELNDETFEEVVLSTISRDDIATTNCIINGLKGSAFLDTCASINIVTKQFLNNIKNIKPIGYTTNNIIQVTSKTNLSSELYVLTIDFGNLIIKDVFRVIEQSQDLFDVLIGYSTLRDNKLFINPLDNYLCRMNEDESWIRVAPLSMNVEPNAPEEEHDNDNVNHDSLLLCFISKIDINNSKIYDEFVSDAVEGMKENTSEIFNKRINETEVIFCTNCNTKETEINKMEEIEIHEDDKESIINNIIDNSPEEIRSEFERLLRTNIEILATKTEELGKTKLMPHSIQIIKDAAPIKQKTYRLSKVQADALKEELTKLLENNLIEPSCSPWSSPVILVPKKNKKWRMCIDFRKLNDITVKDAYCLPLIDEILFSIGRKVKVFTTIDLFSGFHQIPMNEEDIPKTSFSTIYGNYQFKVMPFGLCNAPGTFQREMNRIFFPLIGRCLFVYIDDLIVFSNSYEEHLDDLFEVFKIIRENGLKLNLEKCNFFQNKVELLGHTISTDGIEPIQTKVKVVAEWLPPNTVNQLQSFLGSVGYYRKFIYNFASIAKPLFSLLKKKAQFLWTDKENESFEELKRRLITAPILRMPDFSKQFIIRTDASFFGLGGVLLQNDDEGKERPIHFISRSLKPAEKNYGITDLEGTAAAFCVKKFKSYISGNPYETLLYTDHKPLVSLFKSKETNNARQTRWVLLLSMLKVKVIYEPGKKNYIADALSRFRSKKEEIISTIISEVTSTDDDELLKTFEVKFVKIKNENYYVDNGTFRKVISDDKEKLKLILAAHNVGHEGIFKTYNRLKRDYYWTNMALDVKYIVTTCKRCQLFKPQTSNSMTETIPTKPGLPFSKVGLDIVGPLPLTIKGNQYIIVLVDYLTKWVEAEPTSTIESTDVIYFLSKVFARHGIPEVLITDNGPQFRSDKTKSFLDLYGVFVHYTAVYHPESNGMVENRNKEIGKYLRILCNNNPSIWDEILPSALWALRTTKNETTKFSSFELLYGRRDLQPFELIVNLDKKEDYESQEEYLIRRFTKHHKWIKEAINNIQTANRIWEDRRKQMRRLKAEYKPGDLVLIKLINRRKLDPYFVGPMKIVKKQLNTVTVCDPITNEIADRNVHLKNIIPYKLCELKTSRDEV